jgi:Leucine-rich repeat (LRR) protein
MDNADAIEKKIKGAEEENYLDFSNLDLSIIPILPQNLENIDYLFLNDNKFNKIEFDLNFFKKLTVLDLSDNPIEEILCLPPNLIELVCNNCEIKNICFHPTIKKIHCMNNKLLSLEEYPLLEDLQCGNNKLNYIPSLINLKFLSCFENPIQNFNHLPNLKVLNCANTLFEGKINFAPSITHLACDNTKISDISNLDNLAELEMNNTDIKELPYLTELKSISINTMNINLSPNYKIKNIFNLGDKINIIFE